MLAFLLFLFSVQTGAKLDAAKLPQTAATVREFIPQGWEVEAQIVGDLNRDLLPDIAVTLVESMPANADKDNPPERERALLILFKSTEGNLYRAALANKVLACTRCGGAFYGMSETPTTVEIKNGVIVIQQDYGSRELTKETFRFRYNPDIQRFVLIGTDVETHDRLTGDGSTESTNFLTGVKLITKTKLTEQAGKKTLSNVKQQVSRDKKFIEDVVRGYDQ